MQPLIRLSSEVAIPSTPPREEEKETKINHIISPKFALNHMTIKRDEFFLFRFVKWIHAAIWYDKTIVRNDGTEIYLAVSDIAKKLGLHEFVVENTYTDTLLDDLNKRFHAEHADVVVDDSPPSPVAASTDTQPLISPTHFEADVKMADVSFDEAVIVEKPSEEDVEAEKPLTRDQESLLKECDISKLGAADKAAMRKYVRRYSDYEARYGHLSGIKAKTLSKATAIALTKFHGKNIQAKQEFIHVPYNPDDPIVGDAFLAREEEGKLHVVQILRDAKQFGTGTYGKVTQVFHGTEGAFMAFKKAHQGRNMKFINIEKEALTRLNAVPNAEGVQGAAVTTFDLMNNAGIVGPEYRTDLHELSTKAYDSMGIDFDPKVLDNLKTDFCRQLVKGLQTMAKAGVIHGDLKLQNILVEVIKDKFILRIGDWGTARFYEKPLETLYSDEGECSNYYSAKKDKDTLVKYSKDYVAAAKGSDAEKEAETKFREAAIRQDIYSLGSVFYGIFTGAFPYGEAYDYQSFPRETDLIGVDGNVIDPAAKFEREALLKSGCPAKLADLIERMVSLEPSQRPDLSQIEAEFNSGAF